MDTVSLAKLSRDSGQILVAVEDGTLQKVVGEKEFIAGTGINADQFLHKLERVEGVGGPEVSLDMVQLDGVSDRDFSQAYFRAEANLEELADLAARSNLVSDSDAAWLDDGAYQWVRATSGSIHRPICFSSRYRLCRPNGYAGARDSGRIGDLCRSRRRLWEYGRD